MLASGYETLRTNKKPAKRNNVLIRRQKYAAFGKHAFVGRSVKFSCGRRIFNGCAPQGVRGA